MKERPILFNAERVRAILAGTKTQTRRPVKPQPLWPAFGAVRIWKDAKDGQPILNNDVCLGHVPKIVYKPGDRLWVRETWCCAVTEGEYKGIAYKASYDSDSEWFRPLDFLGDDWYRAWDKYQDKWRPSIFMPRWASRITLEVTAVRVERLQDITEEDAKAEGVKPSINGTDCGEPTKSYRTGFVRIWQGINSETHSWQSNPWVWVVTFKQ